MTGLPGQADRAMTRARARARLAGLLGEAGMARARLAGLPSLSLLGIRASSRVSEFQATSVGSVQPARTLGWPQCSSVPPPLPQGAPHGRSAVQGAVIYWMALKLTKV